MPELPEVEYARRMLVKWFDGHELVRTEADHKARTFRGAKVSDFEAVKGRLELAERKGKYLMLGFSDGHGLVAHLGMSGKFVKRPAGVAEQFSRARFVLDDGEVIHFRDPRLFGRIEPTPREKLKDVKAISELGLDPLVDGLTGEQLKGAVGATRQDLKVAIMDQSRIAGLGNIHAAEALFRAGLHPGRKPETLTDDEWAKLAAAIHETIQFALDEQGSGEEISYVEEPGTENPFLIYGREGEPCTKCGTTVKTFTQGGRTTHYCPSCQPKGLRGQRGHGRAPPRRKKKSAKKKTKAKKTQARRKKR